MGRFWRFTPLVALTAAVALLLAAAALGVYAERDYREQKIQEAVVQARILARAVAAPLAFSDRDAAAGDVAALRANPAIVAAAVYDAEGKLFVSFLRENARPTPGTIQPGTISYAEGRVGVAVPVSEDSIQLGVVYLRTVTQSFAQRATQYVGLLLLGFMMLIVLAVLGMGQAAVNRANAELRLRAKELEETNTQLHEQIAAREETEAALRQSQKMETIGQLTGGVAHDFNNLLAIILGNLERLKRRLARGDAPTELARTIDNAMAGAERAAALTHSLLAFARRQPLRPEPVDINRLVSGISELLRRTLGETITIETVVAGGLWRVSVDPNQLESTILNLAVNARDAMPEGGQLTIETANAYLDERYVSDFEDLEAGQYVLISITDTGVGMSREVIDRVFEPFFTTKEVGHGTGLGLSQVYGLVKQSGGHIKLYSEPGEGTTIKIYLPRLMSDEEPRTTRHADPAETVTAGPDAKPVLVVEDDPGVREHSVALLTELGYPVIEAADGEEALRLLADHPEIALLFTDVGLPGGMNGRELAEEALHRRPDLAVLYTTGYARNAIVHDGRLDPGVHLVTKPFTYAELGKAVRKVMQTAAPHVLIIEDELMLRNSTADNLTDLGCMPVEVGTAADAYAALRKQGDRIVAAIVDLNLPDQRGDGIAVHLRAEWPALPLIIATGAGLQAIREELVEDAMVSVLQKPYNGAQIEQALEKAGVRLRPRPR
ncbi:MAG: response regulator [Acetobacterales bacterium]